VQFIRSTSTRTGADALTTDQQRQLLTKLRVSEMYAKSDQEDPIIRRGDAYTAPQVAFRGSNRRTRPTLPRV